MSRWNNSTPEERITRWREFRSQIENLSFEEQLHQVATYFADLPLGSHSVNYHAPEEWPSPWEIIYHKQYCRSSAGILMYDTLKILNSNEQIGLYLINDEEDTYLVPVVNHNRILNYVLGEISNLHTALDVQILDRFENGIDRDYH